MLADVFPPTESVAAVRANMHAPRKCTGAHISPRNADKGKPSSRHRPKRVKSSVVLSELVWVARALTDAKNAPG